MSRGLWMLTILSGLLIGQAAPTRAQEPVYPNRALTPPSDIVFRQGNWLQDLGWQPPQANPAGAINAAGFAQGSSAPTAMAGGQPLGQPVPTSGPSADGTWRDDGRYVTINVNGQVMRLVKESLGLGQQIASEPNVPSEGSAHGRLLHRERPLVNCHVVLVPMHEGKEGSYDQGRQPLTTTTDEQGFYHFDHVPVGAYKLTWLPEHQTQWIRRIAMKPDVLVHQGEDVPLKDVRMAMQTIN